MMADVRLKIAPPWVTYVNQTIALFGEDSEVDVNYDNAARALTLRVSNDRKASAIARLLPSVKEYGNEALTVTVVPPNGGDLTDYEWHSNKELFDAAFENNPVYCTAVRIDTIFSNDITYVVFKNKVVQFFNDNLNDLHGNVSTLYQEIAHDVFDMTSLNGVMFCTDIEAKVGMPLGEWP